MAELTREAFNWFFGVSGIKCFRSMDRAKAICEMRLKGQTYQEIGDMFNVSRACAYEIVARVVRRWNKYQALPQQSEGEFTSYELNRIKSKYKSTPIEDIAKELKKPVAEVEKQIAQMLADGAISSYRREINPNPVTSTTKMLICRYHEDNINKGLTEAAAIHDIACELSREVTTIKEVLEECRANGMYELHNQYGKTFAGVW